MKKDNSKNIIIGVLVIIIVGLIIFIGLLVTDTIKISFFNSRSNVSENNKDNSNVEVIDKIVGSWNLSSAMLNGEEYNHREIFGSCIEYGNKFTINSDYTYSLSIGCTVNEKGTFSIDGINMIFTNSEGKIYSAFYGEEDEESVISYHYPIDDIGNNLYLLFKKTTNGSTKEQVTHVDYEEVITIDSTGESYTVKYDFTEQENYVSTVEEKDRVVTITDPISINQLYILDKGNLYYYVGKNTDLNNRDISKMEKYEELSNIKRIKPTHTTPTTGISLFLITNSGEIFSLSYDSSLLKFDLNKIEEFGNYKFDDIINYETAHGPGGSTYSVILQNGTILTKTIEY